MPVTFSQIANNTAHVTVQVANLGPVTVEYYPNKLTSKYVAKIEAGDVDDDHLLQDLIKSWDIYVDDDFTEMWPLERINEFGYQFKVQVAMAIVEDMRPEAMASQTKALNGNR
jgi:hypothetical protein